MNTELRTYWFGHLVVLAHFFFSLFLYTLSDSSMESERVKSTRLVHSLFHLDVKTGPNPVGRPS